MKFVRGLLVGTIVTAGITMMYNGNMERNKKRIIKKGTRAIKKMGII